MPTSKECLFCRIIRKEIPAQIIYEDAATMAVLDVNPRAPGHTMILPRDHVNSILELDDQHLGPTFHTVKRIVKALKATFAPDGFTIGINHGRAAGQAIDHLHIHVIPRWSTDGGGSIHSVVSNPPQESLAVLRSKIVEHLT